MATAVQVEHVSTRQLQSNTDTAPECDPETRGKYVATAVQVEHMSARQLRKKMTQLNINASENIFLLFVFIFGVFLLL